MKTEIHKYLQTYRSLIKEADGDSMPQNNEDDNFDLNMGGDEQQPETSNPEPQPENPSMEQPEGDMGDESIEVDVTSIVEKQDELAQSIQSINSEIEQVKQMIQNLNNTGQIIHDFQTKISALEANITSEFKKRLPTERERLEDQKKHSYPFNTRLSDFFESEADKKSEEEKEYSLTDVDVANNLAKMGGTIAKTF